MELSLSRLAQGRNKRRMAGKKCVRLINFVEDSRREDSKGHYTQGFSVQDFPTDGRNLANPKHRHKHYYYLDWAIELQARLTSLFPPRMSVVPQ